MTHHSAIDAAELALRHDDPGQAERLLKRVLLVDPTHARANELMAEGKIRPVLWRAMGFEGVPEAHQLLRENKHHGKISIMVGATDEAEGKHEDGPGAIRAEVGA